MEGEIAGAPESLAAALRAQGTAPAWLVLDPAGGGYRTSHPGLQFLAGFLDREPRDVCGHEAFFLGAGPETGALFGVAIHRTTRGQAQGGVRRWRYRSVEDLLRDGLRLSLAMTRKNALARLWWGGGKGVIAQPPDAEASDPGWRRTLYREWGAFVSALHGCYVTAEDVGTGPADMAEVFRTTRFATCVAPEQGGTGNPSASTAEGVVCAMEAALEFLGLGALEGKRVAVQGAGQVGAALIEGLLARGVARIVASECDPERRDAVLDAFDGRPVEVRLALPGDDDAILAEPCDVLAPCALGGVLDAKTIPAVKADLVCGSANNPLADEERDAAELAKRGIAYVPDFVANRMGIVFCANEQYGLVRDDPAIRRHLDPSWAGGIHQTTLRVLEEAKATGTTPVASAIRLADALADEPHPVWRDRARAIIRSLVEGGSAPGG